MEFINHIELAGVVGRTRNQQIADKTVTNLTIVTESCHKDNNGNAVIEVTWHNVIAWQNPNMPDLGTIGQGSQVNVHGRLRTRRYNDETGNSHMLYEIIADSIRVL